MQGKIRQWFVDNPRAMDAAYVMMFGTSVFWELSMQEAAGATSGP
ncbi:hypothetical protein [Halorussus salinisoli]|nr:hypothetical protein [Halorussus salinisoli]